MADIDSTQPGGTSPRFDVRTEADRKEPAPRTTIRWTRPDRPSGGAPVARPGG